ncbi:vacuolar protein sorting-associated protein 2 homolog 3 [Lathyrus oleraceus]|nr:vacuolar protein sorting-associated protein 2 homolog 3-like [Pisum sativum]
MCLLTMDVSRFRTRVHKYIVIDALIQPYVELVDFRHKIRVLNIAGKTKTKFPGEDEDEEEECRERSKRERRPQAKVIQEFQKQSAQMDITTEMMSDAIDDVLDDDEAEEETEDLTNQVLDEIGVDLASQLSAAPKGRLKTKNTENVSSSEIDDIEKRLAALRNP